MFNVLVLTPSTGFCRMGYSHCLFKMLMYFAKNRVYPECADQTIDFDTVEGSGISANREALVQRALATDCTHILFVDEDMLFAPNTLHIMASKRKEIVGCNYPMRNKGSGFTAMMKDRAARIITGPQSTGLEPASYTGFGFCLIERGVFEKMPQPWFLIGYDIERHSYTTEDAAFGAQLEDINIPWYVDHDASKLISHMGHYIFDWKEVYEVLTKTKGSV